MIKVIYPDKKPKLKREGEKEFIFCMIRKRWFSITPEEWVRQNFLLYLTDTLNYSASLIAVEKTITVGEMKKRFDIVVYQNAEPWMLVECKEQNISLNPETLLQALRYHSELSVEYIVLTNGGHSLGYKKTGKDFVDVEVLPVL